MAEYNFVEFSKELDEIHESGVSFESKSQKWESVEQVKELIDDIEKCQHLIYLNLEGNTLGVEAAKSIGKALEKHSEFKKALWKDLFTGRLKTEIPEALRYLGNGITAANANLTVLDCSDNALGPNGMTGLVDLLKSKSCYSLQELKLNNCGLGVQGGKMLAAALLECYNRSVSSGTPLALKVFIAGRNRLENEGAKALSAVFSKVTTLEELAMPQNGIYHEGIDALSKAFILNKGMRILNLSDNTIKRKGAESLAEAFGYMQKLREIDFADCLLKTNGALVLANALDEDHADLEVLNVAQNEIGPEGGIALASAIIKKSKIRRVNLDANQFGFEGRERIKELMQESLNPEALCSLDQDESEDEGEEEDDNIDTCEEEDNGVESDTDEEDLEGVNYVTALSTKIFDSTVNQSPETNKSVIFAGEDHPPCNVETFCNTEVPSIKTFNALEETDKITAFRNYLKSRDQNYLTCLVFTILKCSSLSDDSSEALGVAQALYKDVFDYALETKQVTRVKNFFLIQLGLLKCEDKKFNPKFNLRACRHALLETLSNNTFPQEIRETFDLFLERFG